MMDRDEAAIGMALRRSTEEDADSYKAKFLRARLRRNNRSKMAALLQDVDAPSWLDLTQAEKRRAADLLVRVSDEYPATSVSELIWCLAADATRPRSRGRKPKWLGHDGIVLVIKVDIELSARGAKSSDRKALRQVIAAIREKPPYDRYSEQRLHDAYYQALPAARKFAE